MLECQFWTFLSNSSSEFLKIEQNLLQSYSLLQLLFFKFTDRAQDSSSEVMKIEQI